jgi:hypothetical protein
MRAPPLEPGQDGAVWAMENFSPHKLTLMLETLFVLVNKVRMVKTERKMLEKIFLIIANMPYNGDKDDIFPTRSSPAPVLGLTSTTRPNDTHFAKPCGWDIKTTNESTSVDENLSLSALQH